MQSIKSSLIVNASFDWVIDLRRFFNISAFLAHCMYILVHVHVKCAFFPVNAIVEIHEY